MRLIDLKQWKMAGELHEIVKKHRRKGAGIHVTEAPEGKDMTINHNNIGSTALNAMQKILKGVA